MGSQSEARETNKYSVSKKLEQDLTQLRVEISNFDSKQLKDGKRYGLPPIDRRHLIQFQRYLEGLFFMVAMKNEDTAITRFKISLQKTNLICNIIAKKTLERMHEILMLRSDRFVEKLDDKAKSQRDLLRDQTSQKQGLKKQQTVTLDDGMFFSSNAARKGTIVNKKRAAMPKNNSNHVESKKSLEAWQPKPDQKRDARPN